MGTILSGVKHTLGGCRGNNYFFTSSLLPFSVLTPQLYWLSFSRSFCQWITGGLEAHKLIPPSPISTTQGGKTRAQRGDLHTMIWITEAFYVCPLIFLHLLYLEISPERYSVLVVFPAGIMGYMPKPRWIFWICNNTYRVQSACVCVQFKHKHVWRFLYLYMVKYQYKDSNQRNKPQVKSQRCEPAHSPHHPTSWESTEHISEVSLGQLPRQSICLSWPMFWTMGGA